MSARPLRFVALAALGLAAGCSCGGDDDPSLDDFLP
jgi:hypothetical protein